MNIIVSMCYFPPFQRKINTCHILLNYFVFRDIRQVRRSLLDLFPLCPYPRTSYKSRPVSVLLSYSVRAGNDVSWKMKFNKYEFRFFPIPKRYIGEEVGWILMMVIKSDIVFLPPSLNVLLPSHHHKLLHLLYTYLWEYNEYRLINLIESYHPLSPRQSCVLWELWRNTVTATATRYEHFIIFTMRLLRKLYWSHETL